MEQINSHTDQNWGEYYEEIDLAKGIAIVLVVLGHSFPDAETSWFLIGKDSFAKYLFGWIYSFHMPLFFLFAGFLLIPRLCHVDVKSNLVKRFKRLMIPYFFFSIIYIGLKTFGASFANHPLSERTFVDIFLGVSPAGGCWFLWVLFVMSVISVLVKKIKPYGLFVVSVVMYVLAIVDNCWMIGKIENVFHNYIWFTLGGIMANYYDRVKQYLNHVAIGIIAFVLLTALQFYTICWWINLLMTFSGIVMIFYLGCMISEMDSNWLHRAIVLLGKYCMDIYIISMLVVIPLRIVYVNFNASKYIPYYPWVIFVTCIGCVLPIAISKYFIRKNKWLKLFVLGN